MDSNWPAAQGQDQMPGASQGMPFQMQNQVQQLQIPMASNESQVRQQILSQNIQNNIASTGLLNFAGWSSALPTVASMSQSTVPYVPAQNPNMQNMSNVTPSAVGNLMGPQASLDSSSQTGNVSGADWQEEIYQKIKSMNELYFPELNEMFQRMSAKLQQHDALPQQPRNEQLEKLRFFKVMLERLIMFLQTNKNEILPNHKEKIAGVQKQIHNILGSNRPRMPLPGLQ